MRAKFQISLKKINQNSRTKVVFLIFFDVWFQILQVNFLKGSKT